MFEAGDGIGGTEEYIGEKSTAQSCINACLEKKMLDPEINGVTMLRGGSGRCYCEKKMMGSNGNPLWKTCKLKLKDGENMSSLFLILISVYWPYLGQILFKTILLLQVHLWFVVETKVSLTRFLLLLFVSIFDSKLIRNLATIIIF